MVVIQGKLDGIKSKYAEINSMSDSVLKTLERVLGLSSNLQRTHENLSHWLAKAEADITAFAVQAPVGEQLIHTQSRQKVTKAGVLYKSVTSDIITGSHPVKSSRILHTFLCAM